MAEPVAIVLAAGAGVRMNSDLPKVVHKACGRPLVNWVVDAVRRVGVQRVLVVVGYQAEKVREVLANEPGIEFVEQAERLGTGHAVQVCREVLADHAGPVIVVAGDSPLVQSTSLQTLLNEYERAHPACLLGTLHKNDPTGLGRIVRDTAGKFVKIVEQKDATEEQRRITEVNMSTYVFDGRELFRALALLRNENQQGEYYLTDVPSILLSEGKDVRALPVLQPREALSVNTPDELRMVEIEMNRMGVIDA